MAYVIMENHLHVILWGEELEKKFARFKSYSARNIIDLFVEEQRTRWLKRLKQVKQNHKKDRDYQFWVESFHPQQIFNDVIMTQKINYIHNNPVKRGYVDKPEHWRYSSARNYAGMDGIMPIDKL
jgi:REP element-mobilizing transposase RayT